MTSRVRAAVVAAATANSAHKVPSLVLMKRQGKRVYEHGQQNEPISPMYSLPEGISATTYNTTCVSHTGHLQVQQNMLVIFLSQKIFGVLLAGRT
ncbi:unnamed protein product [Litomosoides sigmodontis]|uniref:Uncharacterized protein n=1 Tax=Litomosoides sigmodontis TaxID=42156 RepID=A0A3P6SPB7_LITSI|nr:unnamed protein product [Litomosoides sigmodontis]